MFFCPMLKGVWRAVHHARGLSLSLLRTIRGLLSARRGFFSREQATGPRSRGRSGRPSRRSLRTDRMDLARVAGLYYAYVLFATLNARGKRLDRLSGKKIQQFRRLAGFGDGGR